jgi:serine/threonine protein kinase
VAECRDAELKSFDLTGKTGSFMYMAPEVFEAEAYNEKADVFSFGCIMSELYSRFILSTMVVGPTGNPHAAMVYAQKVRMLLLPMIDCTF